MVFDRNDAPVLIILGQSNAHGHGTHLPYWQRIHRPMSNVFGLGRKENQQYGLSDVTWSNFTTTGMNLGETQDDTCCLASEFARKWQKETDKGEVLPSLYIIQISIGSQGVDLMERDGLNMWAQQRPPVLKGGSLSSVDISLYPLAVKILSLAVKSLLAMHKRPRILGLHWNQWETEVYSGGQVLDRAEQNYPALFQGLRSALGVPCPIVLYRPLSDVYKNPEGVRKITRIFETLLDKNQEFYLYDLSMSPLWKSKRKTKGIFQKDRVHYTPEAQRYFARLQWDKTFERE